MPGNATSFSNYSFYADVSSLPREAKLYRFVPDNDLEAKYNSIKQIFGFTEDAVVHDVDDVRFLSEENENISRWLDFYFSDGTWQYHDYSRDITDPVSLPSDEASTQYAVAFLVENGLYNERFEVNSVVEQYTGEKETGDYNAYCKSVYFYPTAGGIPVYGVSRIAVSVGDNGGIVGVYHFYKDIDEAGIVDLISPESLYERIENAEFSSSINPAAVEAAINEIFLGYWEDSGSIEEQPYLQPVWVYIGIAVLEDGQEEPFDVIAPAIK